MDIFDLDADTAALILQHLSPEELGKCCCVCTGFRDLCQQESLWKTHATQRWATIAPFLHPESGAGRHRRSWKGLYSAANGWRAPAFCLADEVRVRGDFISALCPFSPNSLWGGEVSAGAGDTWLALATSDGVEVSTIVPRRPGSAGTVLAAYSAREGAVMQSLAALPCGALVAGDNLGAVHFFVVRPPDVVATVVLQASMSPCVDLQVCRGAGRLYAMFDSTFQMVHPAQRNLLQQIDLGTQTLLASAAEFSEQYELVCFAPGGAGADWGNELVAGAVHGNYCTACFQMGLPSLCYHKSTSATAALCVFDLRARLNMVQRFGCHHRSFYPHMCTARDTYIFTSHVGRPLCAWDRRNMSTPVHESQQLGSFSREYPAMPLPPPRRAAAHSAMYLEVDPGGDVLVGRAENGMVWSWDLSATLGWQAPSCPAYGRGSWLSHAAHGAWEDGSQFRDWPQLLGAWPCENCLPQLHLDMAADHQLIGLCSRATESEFDEMHFVACASLQAA